MQNIREIAVALTGKKEPTGEEFLNALLVQWNKPEVRRGDRPLPSL